MTPEVSVLLPVRNAAATLAIALKSTLRSRGVDLEVVAVDHASDDATPGLLARFAAHDARVSVVSAPRDVDVAGALCVGRALCHAPLIARMDGDDVMHPDRLRDDVAWLAARPKTAAVACRAKLLPKSDRGALAQYVAWQNATLDAASHANEIWIEQPLCQPATTLRASVLDDVGGYRSGEFPEDYDLFLRLVVAGYAIEKRPAVQHGWRRHPLTSARWSRDTFAAMKARALVTRFGVDARPLYIAGAGKEGGRIARALIVAGAPPAGFFDVAARRIGRARHGVVVHPASDLARVREAEPRAFVVAAVGTSGSRGVVRAQLADAGFVEGEDCVVVA